MNGVRRFLASTVQGSTQTSTVISDQPPHVERAPPWTPQLPGSSSCVSSDTPNDRRRGSSSSTISARESFTSSIVSSNQPAAPLSDAQFKSVLKSPPESPTAPVPNKSSYSSKSREPLNLQRGLSLRSAPRVSATTNPRSGPSPKDKGDPLTRPLAIKSSNGVWKNGASPINARDELLIMLLTSQAVLDSRECEILSAEDVEDLKKVHAQLQKRAAVLSKKIALDTKIRDATASLSRLPSSRRQSTRSTPEKIEVSTGKVEASQRELDQILRSVSETHCRLLEHRAAVLSYTVRNADTQQQQSMFSDTDNSDHGITTNGTTHSGELSPVSTAATSISASSRTKFEGPHLYAGHSDAVAPSPPKLPPSLSEYTSLQEQLAVANETAAVAKREASRYQRELSLMDLEKSEIETKASLESQEKDEIILSLRNELQQLSGKFSELEREKDAQVLELRSAHDLVVGQLNESLQQREGEVERLRSELDATVQSTVAVEERLRVGEGIIGDLLKSLGIILPLGATSLPAIATALSAHVSGLNARLESHEKREADYIVARSPPDSAEKDGSVAPLVPSSVGAVTRASTDPHHLLAPLQELWLALPSSTARAEIGAKSRGGINALKKHKASISDLDVQALKSLYDRPGPASPTEIAAEFTIDAFVERVRSLITDDKALVQRLIRFAQGHELLKSNAERAMKLAQDSTQALETYQKQVKTLEERNKLLVVRHTQMLDDVSQLQDALELAIEQKTGLEAAAAEQAHVLEELQEANNTLSAKALALASEAAEAKESSDPAKSRTEAKVVALAAELEETKGELIRIQTTESTQRVLLLDELNTLQTHNTSLRDQLRAEQRKNGK